jgi:hypothetical protein
MPRTLLNNKNIKRPLAKAYAGGDLNNNSMKRELVLPLIAGILFGAMIMVFWQFTASLKTQNARLTQLETATSQNTQTVNDIVTFINNATKGAAANTGNNAPATTPAQ